MRSTTPQSSRQKTQHAIDDLYGGYRARIQAANVKALVDALSVEAESLQGEMRRFLADVQAA